MVNQLGRKDLLSDKKYGFRFSMSTADLLTIIAERIHKPLDKNGDVVFVALDISKAFDRFWHTCTIHRVERLCYF